MSAQSDLTGMTDDELDALRIDVLTEKERRETLAQGPATIEQIAAQYRDAAGIVDGTAYVAPTGAHDAIPPDHTRVWEGDLWRNTSGTYLSHSPGEYPAGWTLVEEDESPSVPDPADHPEWTEGATYAVDDLVSFEGSVYRCVQAHTAHVGAGWTPTAHTAGWVKV